MSRCSIGVRDLTRLRSMVHGIKVAVLDLNESPYLNPHYSRDVEAEALNAQESRRKRRSWPWSVFTSGEAKVSQAICFDFSDPCHLSEEDWIESVTLCR